MNDTHEMHGKWNWWYLLFAIQFVDRLFHDHG